MYSNLVVSLHLTSNDSCKVVISKIALMNEHKRAYDFHELVNIANTLNHIFDVKCMRG